MNIRIINADVLEGLATLPDQSVHCVITSPPYWGLRDYGTARWEGGDPNCDHEVRRWDGPKQTQGAQSGHAAKKDKLNRDVCPCGARRIDHQIGLEESPEDYLDKMVEVFREVRRVLRDDGTLWLNLGDSYANAQPRGRMEDQGDLSTGDHGELIPKRDWSCWNLKQKDLVGMCWRVAFALQADGWYLRSDIVWAKPNPMPESVTDRPTRSHEYIFLLAKSARYFYDADAVREEHKEPWRSTGKPDITPTDGKGTFLSSGAGNKKGGLRDYVASKGRNYNPAGRNRRDVWTITTQPTPEAHFATFPEALVQPCIKAGTSERGCCPACGVPWVRVVEKGEPLEDWKKECGADREGGYSGQSEKYLKQDALGKQTHTGFNARWKVQNASDVKRRVLEGMRERISQWQPSCTCDAGEPVPCTVLDPFGGSGTVAKVARDLDRSSILIELNPEYVGIIKKRLRIGEQLDVGVCSYEVVQA